MDTNIPAPLGSPPPPKGHAATDATVEDATATQANRNLVPVTLDEPITIGETVIDKVTLRKPKAGELRGLTLDDLIASDIDTLLKLIPRISSPVLAEEVVSTQLSPVDLGQIGGAVRGFFMTKGQHETLRRMIEES